MNRITNQYLNNQSLSFLNSNLYAMSKLQEQLSSNRNINRASDDPVGLTRIMDLSGTLKADERFKRNVDSGISEVNTADTAVSNLTGLLQRAQELATQGANFSNNQQGRDAIALEIDQIINQMVQLGNTDIGGKYIFGGFATDQPPFTRAGNVVTYNGSPAAGNWQRDMEVAQGMTLSVNVNGESLLGSSTGGAGPLPVPPATVVGGAGLFQTMTELLVDLRAAGDPNQLAQIRARLDDLTADLGTLSSQQAVLGATSNRLELTKSRIEERTTNFTQQYAGIQNIDTASVIANLNQQENVFQASLAVTGRLNQVSLLNFLG